METFILVAIAICWILFRIQSSESKNTLNQEYRDQGNPIKLSPFDQVTVNAGIVSYDSIIQQHKQQAEVEALLVKLSPKISEMRKQFGNLMLEELAANCGLNDMEEDYLEQWQKFLGLLDMQHGSSIIDTALWRLNLSRHYL